MHHSLKKEVLPPPPLPWLLFWSVVCLVQKLGWKDFRPDALTLLDFLSPFSELYDVIDEKEQEEGEAKVRELLGEKIHPAADQGGLVDPNSVFCADCLASFCISPT